MSEVVARETLAPQFSKALEFAAGQAERVLFAHPGYYPMYTVGGRWNREGERWTHWCEGFFPGILWLLFKYPRDESFATAPRGYTRRLEPRQHDPDVHDLVFVFLSTELPNQPPLQRAALPD